MEFIEPKVLSLNPGDVVVLTLAARMRPEEIEDITKAARDAFPGHKAVVLDHGMAIESVSPDVLRELLDA